MRDYWVERFYREAIPIIIERFNPKKILLFGSRIRGNAVEDSDLDVIIVSDYFKDIPFMIRSEMVLKTVEFPIHVDYLCYTEEEFKDIVTSSSIVQDALEYAEEVYRNSF